MDRGLLDHGTVREDARSMFRPSRAFEPLVSECGPVDFLEPSADRGLQAREVVADGFVGCRVGHGSAFGTGGAGRGV